MNLKALMVNTANLFEDNIALIEGKVQLTFREVNDRVNQIANGLVEKGFEKGDRISIYIKNCHEYLIFRMAMEKIGVVYVPINYYLSNKEVEYIIKNSGSIAIVCDKDSYENISQMNLEDRINFLFSAEPFNLSDQRLFSYHEFLEKFSKEEPPIEVDDTDLCSINYTSGTTGKPKGVMLSQRNWIEVYKNMLINRDINHTDRLLHLGPLTHASGSYFMPFFLKGAQSIVMPKGFEIDNFFTCLEKYRITAFTCVPTILIRIMNDSRIETVDKSSLKMIGYGASPMPTDKIKKALDLFGPILVQNYGQTEAYMTISYLSKEDHVDAVKEDNERLASVGKPYTFVQVEILDDDGKFLEPGQVGELVVKSDHVMQGYWNLPEETKATLRNGWLLTGDLAKKDSQGYIYLLGRKKEMIISGGFNIYPREIEEVLHSIPYIQEAAVIGVKDDEWGERVVAYVVTDSQQLTFPLEEINHICKKSLGYKKPKEYILLDSLPKNTIGKIDKKRLKEMYETKRESAQIG